MNNRRTIITIGMFDGVHRGHRYLLEKLQDLARELNMQAAVFSFDLHPMLYIDPDKAPKQIMTLEEKYLFLSSIVKKVFIINSKEKLFELTAREFILALKQYVNVKAILMGYNNSFGSDRIKTPEELAKALEGTGIEVYSTDKYDKIEVSSTAIRQAIEAGEMEKITRMLARSFSFNGIVVEGKHNGTKLGYPTANIEVEEDIIIPGPGVYAAYCMGCPTMLNIGKAPTMRTDGFITVEAHIITDYNINDEKVEVDNLYGKEIHVIVLKKIRDEKKFDSAADLVKQLDEDRKKVIEIGTDINYIRLPLVE